MKVLGNILWIVLGGFIVTLAWFFFGVLNCITIIGIPIGIQAFKLAKLAFLPFGKTVVHSDKGTKILLNVLWILLGGLWLAAIHAVLGLLCCITIVGIPFGKQHFKLVKLAFAPFGAEIQKV